MAREITMFETQTEPPTVHRTLQEAVSAELAILLGHKGNADSQSPGIARQMAENPAAFIACLQQLTTPETPKGDIQ